MDMKTGDTDREFSVNTLTRQPMWDVPCCAENESHAVDAQLTPLKICGPTKSKPLKTDFQPRNPKIPLYPLLFHFLLKNLDKLPPHVFEGAPWERGPRRIQCAADGTPTLIAVKHREQHAVMLSICSAQQHHTHEVLYLLVPHVVPRLT
ncbi:hypothetical protein JOB18_005294 [Solea senegalensis]|uniref:Uncharacterized protein n=1 Tax=Solea senegalensis TaxID=28829 RepID=A0AAV6T4D5_SOLSE|nr:hypothetical protein JOB18_005294 [Solea senegalensis]